MKYYTVLSIETVFLDLIFVLLLLYHKTSHNDPIFKLNVADVDTCAVSGANAIDQLPSVAIDIVDNVQSEVVSPRCQVVQPVDHRKKA